MKKIVIAFLLLLPYKMVWAQKDSLSYDERSKYIYYHVIPQPGLTVDTFRNRSVYFLRMEYPQNKIDPVATPGTITGSGKWVLLSGITAAKHVDGELDYTFHVEYKNEKYRYWLTDFVFIPYKVDRYGNSVPQEGMDVPLEEGSKKLDKGQFNSCLNQAAKDSKQFGDKLKQYMVKISATPAKDEKKKVITTKDW